MIAQTPGRHEKNSPAGSIQLRDVLDGDLELFFVNQLDPDANHMAAFTAKNPADRDAFNAFWAKIRANNTIMIKTILVEGQVVGSVLSYVDDGKPEVSYWFGKEYWGRGIATLALAEFLKIQTQRPIYARAAKDNIPSLRVLEKCGFILIGEARGYANARGNEIDEVVLELKA
jgi:RimJ/RimL family protein N-acetyltransferase